jgi:hypothetical protein
MAMQHSIRQQFTQKLKRKITSNLPKFQLQGDSIQNTDLTRNCFYKLAKTLKNCLHNMTSAGNTIKSNKLNE